MSQQPLQDRRRLCSWCRSHTGIIPVHGTYQLSVNGLLFVRFSALDKLNYMKQRAPTTTPQTEVPPARSQPTN